MALYLIEFDLRDMGRDYKALHDTLKSLGAQQALRSAWFIESSQPIRYLSDSLLGKMGQADGLFIVEVTSNAAWAATRLLDNAGLWLKKMRP